MIAPAMNAMIACQPLRPNAKRPIAIVYPAIECQPAIHQLKRLSVFHVFVADSGASSGL